MTLIELCEPLFQYVCRLSRSARKGGAFEHTQVQAEIKALLVDIKAKSAGTQPPLVESFDKIEIVLMFFVDFMIKESALPWAKEWKELAFERNELAGDEKFFDLLEDTLKDRSPSAPERLAVFYTCLGLGFTGWYTGQPEFLRRKMKEIAGRLQTATESGGGDIARICPDAYEHVDTRDLVEPPGTKLLGIGHRPSSVSSSSSSSPTPSSTASRSRKSRPPSPASGPPRRPPRTSPKFPPPPPRSLAMDVLNNMPPAFKVVAAVAGGASLMVIIGMVFGMPRHVLCHRRRRHCPRGPPPAAL